MARVGDPALPDNTSAEPPEHLADLDNVEIPVAPVATTLDDDWYLQPNAHEDVDVQRAAATELGLNYDDLSDSERPFIAAYAAERARGRIDLDNQDPVLPSPDGATTDDATATGSGPGVEASAGGGEDGGSAVPPVASAQPSPIAPAVAPTPPAEPMVDIPGLGPVSAALVQAVAAAVTAQTPTPPAPAPVAPVPIIPADLEWEDPNIGTAVAGAFATLQGQMNEIAQGQQLVIQSQLAREQQVLHTALTAGETEWRGEHPEVDDAAYARVLSQVGDNSLLAALAPKFEGNPHGLAKHALEMGYWADPELRAAHEQALIAAHTTSTREVATKKAAQAGIAAPQGSAATPTRGPSSGRTPEGLKEMADFIARSQNGNGALEDADA